jgi:hypothetical protein
MRCKVAGTGNPPSASSVGFLSPMSSTSPWSATEDQFCCVPVSGFLTNLRVNLSAAPGVGKSRTIALRVNSVDILSVTISDNARTGIIVTRAAVVAGDLISMSTTPSGSPASATVSWCMDFQGSSPQQAVIVAASSTSATGLVYVPIMSNQGSGASAPANEVIISTPGTISNLAIFLSSALASGTRTFTLRKNGVNQTPVASFAPGDQFKQDNVNSVSVVAGDRLVIQAGGSATAFTWVAIGMVFTPSTADGYSSITCGCPNSPSTSVANYQPVSGAAGSWNASEAAQQHVMNACTLKRLEIRLGTAPGAGKSWQFNVKVNGGYVGMQVSIADTATTGAIDLDVPIANGDLIDFESIPTGTPTLTGRFEWAVTTYQLNPAGRSIGVIFG